MQALAREVACYLGMDLGGIKIKRFADGEIYVQVQVGSLPEMEHPPVCGWFAAACCVRTVSRLAKPRSTGS